MLALTLTQPWATLVAIGAKKIETRGWSTGARGRLAIHAAKGWTRSDQELVEQEPFRSALAAAGFVGAESLPRGVVVAVVRLAAVLKGNDTFAAGLSREEAAFGGYGPGRFAWMLEDVARLAEPVEARGMLGLFELPAEVAALVEARLTPALVRVPEGPRGAAGEFPKCRICGRELDGGHMGEECPNETQAEEDARHEREREDFEERAAIIESEAGRSREDAEREARELIYGNTHNGRELGEAGA